MNSIMEPTRERQQIAFMETMLSTIKGTEEKVTQLDSRVIELEHNMSKEVYVTSGQRRKLVKAVQRKVREILSTPEQYSGMSRKLFAAIWSDFKDEFDVSTYHETPRIKADMAMKFIDNWRPVGVN